MTQTHTIARLTVSAATYDEIRGLLEKPGYRDYQLSEGVVVLDLTGIGLERREPLKRVDPSHENGTETAQVRRSPAVPYELRTPAGTVQVWPMGDGQWQWRTFVPDYYSSVARGLSPSKGNAIIAGLNSIEGGHEAGADFVHPNWTELFDGPEAYLAWRAAQGAA